MSSPFKQKALIIGYGIAGPIAAMFLKRAGFESVIYEAQNSTMDHPGMFMGLGPNGINILKSLKLDAEVMKYGFPTTGILFLNNKGKLLGRIKTYTEADDYSDENIIIKLGALQNALLDALIQADGTVEFGKRLVGIKVTRFKSVIATFADGTEDEGDFLIGCDGMNSRTRQFISPFAAKPSYTGIMECSGCSFNPAITPTSELRVIYGKNATFGYFATPSGDVHWFSNFSWAKPPSRAALNSMTNAQWQQKLLDLYREDLPYISEIIRTTKSDIGAFPIHDLPVAPRWHRGPVCIAGDATHATSPHVGQGASTAMEDAIVLAKCLRDLPDVERAFKMYEHLRKERTRKIVEQAQNISNIKIAGNPLTAWLRDHRLPSFLSQSAKLMDWIYSYEVDWDEEIRLPRPSRYGKMFNAARTMRQPAPRPLT